MLKLTGLASGLRMAVMRSAGPAIIGGFYRVTPVLSASAEPSRLASKAAVIGKAKRARPASKLKVRRAETEREKCSLDLLQTKVAVQLMVAAGGLGRPDRGPLRECIKSMLGVWWDWQKEKWDKHLEPLIETEKRLSAQRVNIIARVDGQSLVVYDGKTVVV